MPHTILYSETLILAVNINLIRNLFFMVDQLLQAWYKLFRIFHINPEN